MSRPRVQYERCIVCGFQICDEIPEQLSRRTARLYSCPETANARTFNDMRSIFQSFDLRN